MQHQHTAFGFVLVLEPGDELIRSLIAFARQEDIDGAVCTGAGHVREAEIGIYDSLLHDFNRRMLREDLEVCALTGTIGLLDGEPFPYVHGVFARADLSTIGGRVFEAVCGSTLELALYTTPTPITRAHLPATQLTGLKLER